MKKKLFLSTLLGGFALTAQALPVVSFDEGGGFALTDAATKTAIPLGKPSITKEKGATLYEAKSEDFVVKAKFVPEEKFIRVTGEIENLRGEARGLLLDYKFPLKGEAPVFSADLQKVTPVKAGEPVESNAFPVAALETKDGGVAIAIPPSDPRIFGLLGDEGGLTVRFYLGLTPKTKLFPNRATFTFLIYDVASGWGFRSALSQYYKFFPDYYTPRLKKDGLYMFQMGGRTPPNVDQYGFDLFETQLPSFTEAIKRNQKHDITTFPYMIVGQREIKYLPELPTTYEQAMAIFDKWTPADHSTFALCKENACALGDIYLKEEVENSAVKMADGRYSLLIRTTVWGANSITFKQNPSPYLFEGENRRTVGGDALALTDQWLKDHPEYGGMFIDSLGANWPAVFNYREDHFAFARYPLSVDPSGRVALDNSLSHYEYINALRDKMRSTDRLLNGNGVYAYLSKRIRKQAALEKQEIDGKKNEFIAQAAPPEFYRTGVKISRFFLASLLDVASCEFGSKATVEQNQDCRTLLGPKQFAFLNYQWEDGAKVQEFVNKSLCFGIFASTTTNFFSGDLYESHPNGYLRDKPLLDWYVPLVRRLSQAGWEPLRYAKVEEEGIFSERFGRGASTYFTVYNDGTEKKSVKVSFDLVALGYQPGQVQVKEIGRETPVALAKDGSVTLDVEPKKTYVLELSKPAEVAARE